MSRESLPFDEPLKFVEQLFEKKKDITIRDIKQQYKHFFSDESNIKKICSLNQWSPSLLIPNSLVHFRCMIQDIYEPEYFLGRYYLKNKKTNFRKLKSGLLVDIFNLNDNDEIIDVGEEGAKHMERYIYYCVPVPGENHWFQNKENNKFYTLANISTSENNSDSIKRKTSEDDVQMEKREIVINNSNDNENKVNNNKDKKFKTEHKVDQNKKKFGVLSYEKNFPIENQSGFPAIIKIYDEIDNLELNEVVEVFGVLSTDPRLAYLSENNDGDEDMDKIEQEEIWSRNPQPHFVPRIHVIFVNKLSSSPPFSTPFSSLLSIDEIGRLRDKLISFLDICFFGDRFSSVYFLCHMISKIYSRQDITALGKLSLNFSHLPPNLPPSYVRDLYEILTNLFIKSHYLPLSISLLNQSNFIPVKNYEKNRLTSGLLQLSPQTHLIIDETSMQPGQLVAKGIKNLQTLSDLNLWQNLPYDFQFHSQTFPTDLRVLVFSYGKSLIECDCVVPMQPSPPSFTSSLSSALNSSFALTTEWDHRKQVLFQLSTPQNLDQFRLYLNIVHHLTFSIQPQLQRWLEEELVNVRREESATTNEMHLLLTLSRYLALSYGNTEMTEEIWKETKDIEKERKNRIKKY